MRSNRKPSASRSKERTPTLSPTRIGAYLECAVLYKYIYVDKIGRFYSRARAGYSFGSTLHHVLQDFHAQGGIQPVEEMQAELSTKWIGAGYETGEQEQQSREAGEKIVQAYHAAHQERLQAQVETIGTEKTLSYELGKFKLSGRLDRIDRHRDGRLEIIDYKSGRWETSSEEVANSLALSCYQLILKRLYPDSPVFATIYCLRSGLSASAELSDEELKRFEQDIRVLGEEILERDYTEVRPVPLDICPTCDFLPRCRSYWSADARLTRLDEPHSEEGL